MRSRRLAVAFGLAGWFVGGPAGYYFDGGIGLGLVCGLLAAILGMLCGGTADVLDALNGRRPPVLPTIPLDD
jgi:hypothetical protein